MAQEKYHNRGRKDVMHVRCTNGAGEQFPAHMRTQLRGRFTASHANHTFSSDCLHTEFTIWCEQSSAAASMHRTSPAHLQNNAGLHHFLSRTRADCQRCSSRGGHAHRITVTRLTTLRLFAFAWSQRTAAAVSHSSPPAVLDASSTAAQLATSLQNKMVFSDPPATL